MKNFALLAVFTMASMPSSSIHAFSMLEFRSVPETHMTILFTWWRGFSHILSVCVHNIDATCFGAVLWRHSHIEGGENRWVIAREDVICATWRDKSTIFLLYYYTKYVTCSVAKMISQHREADELSAVFYKTWQKSDLGDKKQLCYYRVSVGLFPEVSQKQKFVLRGNDSVSLWTTDQYVGVDRYSFWGQLSF